MLGTSHSGPVRLQHCDEKAVKMLLENITRSHENCAQTPPVLMLRRCGSGDAQPGNVYLFSYETTTHRRHNIQAGRCCIRSSFKRRHGAPDLRSNVILLRWRTSDEYKIPDKETGRLEHTLPPLYYDSFAKRGCTES